MRYARGAVLCYGPQYAMLCSAVLCLEEEHARADADERVEAEHGPATTVVTCTMHIRCDTWHGSRQVAGQHDGMSPEKHAHL